VVTKERLFQALTEINESGACHLSEMPQVVIELRARGYTDTIELFCNDNGLNQSIYMGLLVEYDKYRKLGS
jgi:hypothetical protein